MTQDFEYNILPQIYDKISNNDDILYLYTTIKNKFSQRFMLNKTGNYYDIANNIFNISNFSGDEIFANMFSGWEINNLNRIYDRTDIDYTANITMNTIIYKLFIICISVSLADLTLHGGRSDKDYKCTRVYLSDYERFILYYTESGDINSYNSSNDSVVKIYLRYELDDDSMFKDNSILDYKINVVVSEDINKNGYWFSNQKNNTISLGNLNKSFIESLLK